MLGKALMTCFPNASWALVLTELHIEPQMINLTSGHYFFQVVDAVTPQTHVIFLCSPNNPTGNTLETDRIIALLERFEGIVVIDEAYVDFSTCGSLCYLLDKYPRLVILQTFSKAFGLAGIR